jgi:hypothetical protein
MLTYYGVCSAFESPSALLLGLIQNFEIVSKQLKVILNMRRDYRMIHESSAMFSIGCGRPLACPSGGDSHRGCPYGMKPMDFSPR